MCQIRKHAELDHENDNAPIFTTTTDYFLSSERRNTAPHLLVSTCAATKMKLWVPVYQNKAWAKIWTLEFLTMRQTYKIQLAAISIKQVKTAVLVDKIIFCKTIWTDYEVLCLDVVHRCVVS